MKDDSITKQRLLRRKPSISDLEQCLTREETTKPIIQVINRSISQQTGRDHFHTNNSAADDQTATDISSQNNNHTRSPRYRLSAPLVKNQNQKLKPSISSTFSETIQQFERLLDEAIKVAQAAAEMEVEEAGVPVSSENIRTKAIQPTLTAIIAECFKASKERISRSAAYQSKPKQVDITLPEQHTLMLKQPISSLRACSPAYRSMDKTSGQPASVALSLPVPVTLSTKFEPNQFHRVTHNPHQLLTLQQSVDHLLPPDQIQPKHLEAKPWVPKRSASFGGHSPGNLTTSSSVPALQLNGTDFEEGLKSVDIRVARSSHGEHYSQIFGINSRHESFRFAHPEYFNTIDPKKSSQSDLPLDVNDTEFHRMCNHAPIARNWPNRRKRLSASVACINTSCIGLLLGIYAGEVPAIQYVIIDLDHSIILGNVVLYLGLMASTLFLWPLPLLHGRKPYNIGGLMLALCLQVPQGISVIAVRLPGSVTFKLLLLLARGLSGIALGLCDINLMATLLDLFGASLQSRNPHQEVVDTLDVRRHGGGMGIWLGIWSWCALAPLSLGFMIGAFITSRATVDWGFWISQLILMIVLSLNVITPEVRRSAFRRTLFELASPQGEFSRIARGEIKMHLKSRGPSWWGEEVTAGFELVRSMLKQFGFLILSVYTAWVYAQFVLVLMLVGSLASTVYYLQPIQVGLCAMSLTAGALLATPFQKASWLSRARSQRPRTDSMTLQRSLIWSSHLVRRTIFTLALPAAAIAFTFTSQGPPLPIAVPCVMASFVGFFSSLATAECCGILFEAFDTCDLQPGMTGRPARQSVVRKYTDQRTNFSCYPRIMAGVSIIQACKYGFAAAATGLTGRVTRSLGAMQATSVVAGILIGLTLLLTIVTVRWNTVQMIPELKTLRDESNWEPVVLGKPSGITRRISILEAGAWTRWSEIRRRNRLESRFTGSGRDWRL